MRYILHILLIFFLFIPSVVRSAEIQKMPVVARLIGGLGNQMFVLASTIGYATQFNREICLSKPFNQEFSIPYRICSPEEIERAKMKQCFHDPFNEDMFKNKDCGMLSVYLQDERFFKTQSDLIRRLFTFSDPIPEGVRQLADEMEERNSVAVHIRRGDYISNHHPIMTHDYYEEAADYIERETGKPIHLYIFSNDFEWVQKHFFSKHPFTIVSGNKNTVDMHLMTLCHHNILSPSTFSWWGAWLNNHPDKIVVAPERWSYGDSWYGKNVVLPSWKVISGHDVEGGSIAVVYTAIGEDIQFFDTDYAKLEKDFVPELPKTYFILTDNTDKKLPDNVIRIPLKKGTLIKSKQISEIRDFYYVYFFNANIKLD